MAATRAQVMMSACRSWAETIFKGLGTPFGYPRPPHQPCHEAWLKRIKVPTFSFLQVLESMSRQLAAAMASPEVPLQQTHNPSDPSVHLPTGAYFAPSSNPPSLPFPVKAPGKKSKASTAKAGTAHSTAGLHIPAAHASASALPQWGLAGKALLNNYHMTSLPLAAPAATATATATASAPVTAFKSNVPSPNSNAFSWLHQQSLQQATSGSAAALGSAPALLSSLAGYGATHSRGPITAHLPVTALGRQQAAGAFPTAALGAVTTLGSTQALGTANILGSVLGSGPAHAALELSLLLTTLQSLAGGPNQAEGSNAPQTTLATNCQAAMVQLRDWLSQLQHQALPTVEPVSHFLAFLFHKNSTSV